jgi:hypothetical protein
MGTVASHFRQETLRITFSAEAGRVYRLQQYTMP